jgi:hypothetical protein
VWYFGNGWNGSLVIGACMVFMGSVLFTQEPEKAAAEKEE